MKKFYLCFFIFILLIAFSSFSWATTSYQLDIDLSSMNGSGTLCLNVPDDTYKYVVVTYKPTEALKYSVSISNLPFYYSSVKVGTSMSGQYFLVGNSEGNFYYYNLYSSSASSSNVYQVEGGATTTYGYATPVPSYVSNIYSNYTIYTDNTYSNAYTNNILSVNSSYTNVIFESEGEEEEGFFDNFWQNLIHIVVPDSEDWADLQDSFEDNILSHFNITAWSFDDEDLNYSWSAEYGIGENSAPRISLGDYGEIDLSYFNTILNTPLSFGKIKTYWHWNVAEVDRELESGITLRQLLNAVFTIDLFIVNIILYNKFFAKGE